MASLRSKVAAGGRVVIPAGYRRALGIRIGDDVIVRLEGGAVHIITVDEAIKRAQKIVRQYVPGGHSLVDELIAERRTEAERE